MRNRHRVVWTKGMFLTPQQFQTQDQFFEDALQFRFAASQFANWGVTALDIDADALGNGLFRLAKCTGVMPDGEPFDMPDALAPARAANSAHCSIWSRFSTLHGPAITTTASPPMASEPTRTMVPPGRKTRLASL